MYKNEQETKKKRKEEAKKESFVFLVKHRNIKDNIKLVIIVLVVLLCFSMLSSNYIFAIDIVDENKKDAVGTFEENNEVTDIYGIISQNISSSYQKQVVDVEEEIKFETEYIENPNLPKDEEMLVQKGVIGSQVVTYVRSFENGKKTEETEIGKIVNTEAVNEIIQIGTSEVLKNYNIHIGDTLYATKDVELKKKALSSSDILGTVLDKYDVKTLKIINDKWFYVKYNGKKGYIKCDDLTSESLTPGSMEACRMKKISNSLNEDMLLNSPSGLLVSDFERVFAQDSRDTNNIFKENYKIFSEIETKYNINGVFVAAIGIHESNWGTSNIAKDKKNLFGFGAYDATPYESALTFESYGEGIDTVAKWLAKNYLNEGGIVLPSGDVAEGRFFNGATVAGVNMKYATDTNWKNRVFSIMKDIYNSI